MKHLVMMALVAVLVGVGTVHAQTPNAPAFPGVGYAEVTFGPTFGHKSGGSVGAEAGYFLEALGFGVFAEGGRMSNIATSQIDVKAQRIASEINATFQAKQPATYFDGGVVKRFSTVHHLKPYALVGIGGASVTNKVSFAVGGSDVTGQLTALGVQIGGDLSGSYTKLFVTVGAGAHMTLMDRWIADLSYRFGRVGANSTFEYKAFNTNRLQFGVGTKF